MGLWLKDIEMDQIKLIMEMMGLSLCIVTHSRTMMRGFKSRPYLTVDIRFPSMFNPEHEGFHQLFSKPTCEIKKNLKEAR